MNNKCGAGKTEKHRKKKFRSNVFTLDGKNVKLHCIHSICIVSNSKFFSCHVHSICIAFIRFNFYGSVFYFNLFQ